MKFPTSPLHAGSSGKDHQWKIDYIREVFQPKNRPILLKPDCHMGLRNLGNTCYINSSLQALARNDFLAYFFENYEDGLKLDKLTNKQALVAAFSRIFYAEKRYALYSPTMILRELELICLEFMGRKQQDAQEFLCLLLNAAADDTKQLDYLQRDISPISDCFKGRGVFSMQCQSCKKESHSDEEFFTLSLDIPGSTLLNRLTVRSREMLTKSDLDRNVELTESLWNRFKGLFSSSGSTVITLYDCLLSYALPETLFGDESLFCEECNKTTCCEKKFTVTESPNHLIVHLKRFKYSFFGSKLDTFVQYPLELGLGFFEEKKQNIEYDLYTIIVHSGLTPMRGHYTTYSKLPSGWFLFDDSKVKPVTVDEVLNQEAYLLFYRQRFEQRPQFDPPISKNSSENCLIFKYWIAKFKMLANPGPLVQSHALCPHSYLSVGTQREQLQEVCLDFWSCMKDKFGGDKEPLRIVENCQECRNRAIVLAQRMAEEGKLIDTLSSQKRIGPWFIIPKQWRETWKDFVLTQKVVPEKVVVPGKLNTESLLEEDGNPREGLQVNRDYTVVSRVVWEALKELYECGPEIRREKPDIYGQDIPMLEGADDLLSPEQREKLRQLKELISS